MGELIGAENLASIVTGMGVQSPLKADDGLAVGQVLVTPLDMASAYATVAAVGRTTPPYVIERVLLGDGTVVYDHDTDPALRGEQVLRNTAACQATKVFVEVVERGSPTAAGQFAPERPVGGKSGGDDDAWFAGFTPDLATVVWMGVLKSPAEFDVVSERDGLLRVTGSWIPAEFFALVNERYHAGLPVRLFPDC